MSRGSAVQNVCMVNSRQPTVLKIYGRSDDLIEIDGGVREEFGSYHASHLHFSDGTVLRVEHCPGDENGWRIERVKEGTAKFECSREPDGSEPDEANDVATLTGEVRWIYQTDGPEWNRHDLASALEDADWGVLDMSQLLAVWKIAAGIE